MATIATVVASVRAAVHRPSAGPLTDATLEAWANEEYPPLRRRIADQVPDLFTKATADVVLADGVPTFDVTAAPLSLTDFGKVRIVEFKSGTTYLPLRTAAAWAPSNPTGLAGTYRVKYITKAAPLVLASSTAIDLPEGLERCLIEKLAARVRMKFNENPAAHLAAEAVAWREALVSLMPLFPRSIVNMRGAYWGAFRMANATTVELVGRF